MYWIWSLHILQKSYVHSKVGRRRRFQSGRNSESVLKSSPGKDTLFNSETKHDRRTQSRTNAISLKEDITRQRLSPNNLS